MSECKGMNCGTTTGEHSPECLAQHAAVIAGGRFVKGVPVWPWRLVPVQPTDEMVEALKDTLAVTSRGNLLNPKSALQFAIEAAPQPPSVGDHLQEIAEALDDPTLNDAGQVATGIRDVLTARDQQIAESVKLLDEQSQELYSRRMKIAELQARIQQLEGLVKEAITLAVTNDLHISAGYFREQLAKQVNKS
jgi:hypothetical protein